MGEFRNLGIQGVSRPLLIQAVLIGVLSAGLLAYAVKTGAPLRYLDEQHYVGIARSLHEGRGFVIPECPRPEPWCGRPTAYRPPAWPVVIALGLFLGIPQSLLSILPAIAMVGASIMAALTGVRLAGSWGALAGVAILLYPLNVYTSVLLYPQAFATFLVTLLAYLAVVVSERLSATGTGVLFPMLLTGFTVAVLALSVPTLAFTGVVILGWMAWITRKQPTVPLLSALTFIAPVAVWALRNYIVLGSPVMLSTTTGVNLLVGNNPNATGDSGLAADISATMDGSSWMNEIDQDKYLRHQAFNWVASDPVAALSLYAAKVLNYFSPYNQPYTSAAGNSAHRLIAVSTFGLLILLVLVRFASHRYFPVRPLETLFCCVWLANALVMAAFFTRTRFRQPIDALLLIEAGVATAFLIVQYLRIRAKDTRE